MNQKPILLSRECIRDTLMVKRENQLQGLAGSLYVLNIQTLRRGQLAPYRETMTANRFLNRMAVKRAAPDIVITVRGGMVQEVRSTNPYTTVYIADYDVDSPDENAATEDAEERAAWGDMHVVY